MLVTKSLNNALALSVVLATATIALPFKANALTFNFQFDNTIDSTVTPPIVGTGTLSFDGDPGNGTFALTSLTNLSISFAFGSDTFTLANATTPLGEVLAVISTTGTERVFRFSNVNGFGSGPNGGSIDFGNLTNTAQTILSFEPPGLGGNLNLYFTNAFFGTYGATAPISAPIPEPATVLGLLSVAGIGLLGKRQKQEK